MTIQAHFRRVVALQGTDAHLVAETSDERASSENEIFHLYPAFVRRGAAFGRPRQAFGWREVNFN